MKADEFITKKGDTPKEIGTSGYKRSSSKGKPNFLLLFPKGIPYLEQPITRLAMLLTRGAEIYGARNFEKAEGKEAGDRALESALRHLVQAICSEKDEDHKSAVMFNVVQKIVIEFNNKKKS